MLSVLYGLFYLGFFCYLMSVYANIKNIKSEDKEYTSMLEWIKKLSIGMIVFFLSPIVITLILVPLFIKISSVSKLNFFVTVLVSLVKLAEIIFYVYMLATGPSVSCKDSSPDTSSVSCKFYKETYSPSFIIMCVITAVVILIRLYELKESRKVL